MKAPTLRILSLIGLIVLAAGWAGAADRPNILWLTSEDNGAHWLGCYGMDPKANTPNLDKLAEQGVRYSHFYSNAPVCAAARCTIFTGVQACSLGTQNMRSRYRIPENIRPYVEYLRRAGYYCTNNSKTDYNFAGNDRAWWDECGKKAHYKNRPDGAPFFAIFNDMESHESRLFPSVLPGLRKKGDVPQRPSVSPDTVKLPPHLPDLPGIRKDWATYYDIVAAVDRTVGRRLRELEDAGLAEDTIVFYYSDHGGILPRAKRFLYDSGTRVPLIIRFPAKWAHLAPSGPGGVVETPSGFIDLAPTLLSLAGVDVPSYMQGKALLGGQAVPDKKRDPYVFLYGQRFDATMLHFVRGITDGRYRYMLNFHPDRPRFVRRGYMYQQKGWQDYLKAWRAGRLSGEYAAFFETPSPREELYDMQADPWEMNNLAGDPAHAGRLDEMRTACLDRMRELRDTGLVPEMLYPDVAGEGTMREAVQAPGFPYEEILQLALSASRGDPASLPELKAALEHPHPVMRYWGAAGCVVLGQGAADILEALTPLLNDPAEGVRVLAARAVAELGDRERGIGGLIDILRSSTRDITGAESFFHLDELEALDQVPTEVAQRWGRKHTPLAADWTQILRGKPAGKQNDRAQQE